MKMKKYWIIALLLILVGCDSDNREEKAEAQKKERLEKTRQAMQEMQELCLPYNAVIDWTVSIESLSPFTIELEEALVREDSRPLLLLGKIEDITKELDKYSIHFISEDILFDLYCTPKQVKEIMNHRSDRHQEYAVIVRVSEVKKVRLGLQASDEGIGEIWVRSKPLTDCFIAKGTCLDLLFIGDNSRYIYWHDLRLW